MHEPAASGVVPHDADLLEAFVEIAALRRAPRVDDPQFRWLIAAGDAAVAKIALVALIGRAILGVCSACK
jgi:hypothetical protein